MSRQAEWRNASYWVAWLSAVSSCGSSAFSQVELGLYPILIFVNDVRIRAEIFLHTQCHSRLTMNVITPDDLYSAG